MNKQIRGTTTTSSSASLLPSITLNIIDKAFENGCLDAQTDRKAGVKRLRPTPNIDGIQFNRRQKDAIKAYKIGYMMVMEVFSF